MTGAHPLPLHVRHAATSPAPHPHRAGVDFDVLRNRPRAHYAQISEQICVSMRTVETHRSYIQHKPAAPRVPSRSSMA